MKRVLRYGIFAILLGVLFFAASVSETKAQNILGEILKRMDGYNSALQSMKADVTMVKTNVQLNVADTSIGTTTYTTKTKSRYVRVDWTKPLEEHLSINGDTYELWQPRLNQVITGKVDKAKNNGSVGGALSFMSMSKAQARSNYDVNYIGEEQISGGVKTWHIEMIPKIKANYKKAELWIDANGGPRMAKITELNNDLTTVLLANIRTNETVSTSMFKLQYPSSTKKVKA